MITWQMVAPSSVLYGVAAQMWHIEIAKGLITVPISPGRCVGPLTSHGMIGRVLDKDC
jgi:hypothetical protein